MTRVNRRSLAVVLVVMGLSASACGDNSDGGVDQTADTTEEPADEAPPAGRVLSIKSPATGTAVQGNVVNLELEVSGISLVKADGDTSGRTGHLHVFIDKQPTPVGQPIPRESGIVHTTDNPVALNGLSVGRHDLVVVMGDGAHNRLPDFEARTSVTVDGPSVQAKAPATVPANQPIKVDLSAEGVEIVKADGDRSEGKGHYHVFVDREPPPVGEAIPPQPADNSIVHTADSSIEVGPLAEGEHVIWVILGDGAHYPVDPPVRARVAVTVTPA